MADPNQTTINLPFLQAEGTDAPDPRNQTTINFPWLFPDPQTPLGNGTAPQPATSAQQFFEDHKEALIVIGAALGILAVLKAAKQ